MGLHSSIWHNYFICINIKLQMWMRYLFDLFFFYIFINILTGEYILDCDQFSGGCNYAMRMDWMIWKIADPHTTNRKSASNHGPTGYWSSLLFVDFGTFPRRVMFLLAFSLATRIRCFGAIVLANCFFQNYRVILKQI